MRRCTREHLCKRPPPQFSEPAAAKPSAARIGFSQASPSNSFRDAGLSVILLCIAHFRHSLDVSEVLPAAMASSARGFGVKRLMREAMELKNPTELYFAQPLEENLFEWHFTIRGPPDSDFAGGIYHGRIIFPAEYPMKPPTVILLTPNGRFELHKRICLSISGFHPETWQPSWSIRTALLALVGFMPTDGSGAVGSLNYPPEERRKLAQQSINWHCETCGCFMKDVLLPLGSSEEEGKDVAEARTLGAKISLTEPVNKTVKTAEEASPSSSSTSSEPGSTDSSEIARVYLTLPQPVAPASRNDHFEFTVASVSRIIIILALLVVLAAIVMRRLLN
ncbi:hypothetical protein L596_003001 [Steinernema carpocapsae]|uniref:UBC core domain-containing protein n=1 Tax=Steinernema carpocapsae TaxID=34508 RepID=A0A4U8UR37_STECR|nr:hypothetical protein L596_003001 [Steinernema carpocapsae]